jgi:hypothetical protein
MENYNGRFRRLEVLFPNKPKPKYRNGADAMMAERLTARIPPDEEIMYYLQNNGDTSEDYCSELDIRHSGLLERCDQVFEVIFNEEDI